ncbi:choice-of-anchor D domain-containing protein [Hyalangium versicolor]|uniref:choice-of-anchor D domain-containing protein n=1 Tax=Hyalangium versicolor TaxID=2861190 RepID=UPI001CCAEE73|nr:choice-of-anchor D domain-containing protein [Hyalangium versicolor]
MISLVSFAVAYGDPQSMPDAPAAVPRAGVVAPEGGSTPKFVPNEAVVRLKEKATPGRALDLGGTQVVPILAVDDDTWLVRIEATPSASAGATAAEVTLGAIRELGHDPRVLSASPNVIIPFSNEPTDPGFYAQRWSYDYIRLPDAWDRITGSPNVRIAVIDSGSTAHPDIVWAPAFDPSDNDFNPVNPNTYHHGTMVAGLIGATPNNGKGGAGICWGCQVLPVRSNGVSNGVVVSLATAGLNWVAGYDAATGQFTGPRTADIVNFSFNNDALHCTDSGATIESFRNALARARQRGIFVVAAAGNYSQNTGPAFPADCNDVFSVAATDQLDTLAEYSNRGLSIDLVAPGGSPDGDSSPLFGEDVGAPSCTRLSSSDINSYQGTGGIVSTWAVMKPGPQLLLEAGQSISDFCYRYSSGTSYASPHVSGVAGLMLAAHPGMTPEQLEQVLRLTATPSSGFWGWGFFCPESDDCGAGRLDAFAAVDAVQNRFPPLARATPPYHDFGTVPFGSSGTATIALSNVGWSTMSSTTQMTIEGDPWFSFAYASGACTSGQSCSRPFSVLTNSGTFSVPVRCSPSGSGTRKARLVIPSTTAGGAISVPLRCTSNGVPVLSVPPSLSCGDVRPGVASSCSVAVTNIGTAPLTLSGASVTGAAFSLASTPVGPIAPNASANLTVTCVPPAAQSYSGSLAIASNGGSASVALSCRGFAPVLSVAPASLAFGDVPVNTAVRRSVTLTNTGTATLTVSNFGLGGGPFYPGSPLSVPGTIAPGGSVNFEVMCQPPWISTYSGAVSFVSDGGNVSVPLSCRGYAAEIRAQEFLDFGDVRVGEFSDRPLTITNLGTAPLTISETSLSNNTAFSIVGALPGPIAPGASANLTVRCLPTAAVSYSATLFTFSNGGSGFSGLACRGFAPVLSVAPTSLDFGDVRVGTVSARSLTVTNTGTAPLIISGPTLNNAAYSIVGGLPGPIAASASANLTVRCQPPAVGSYTGTLSFTSNGGSASVALSCRGVAPIISVSPTQLDYGTILVGTTSSRTFTVSNTGTASLLVSSSSLTGADFQLTTPIPFTVAPGASQSVAVACAPPTVGNRTGTLTLQHDAGAPVSIGLRCNAAAGQIEVVEPLGTMALYSHGTGRATIRNVGVGPLHITSLKVSSRSPDSWKLIGPTLPATVAPGATLSWSVKCLPATVDLLITATMNAVHDGLPTGSLFSISCRTDIIVIDDPVPPIEISATEGASSR